MDFPAGKCFLMLMALAGCALLLAGQGQTGAQLQRGPMPFPGFIFQ